MRFNTKRNNRRPVANRDAKEAYLYARLPKSGRPGISSLTLPAKEFRPSMLQGDFESKASCLQEDEKRARLLERTKHQGDWGGAARDLSARLNASTRRYPWPTLASKLYWRDLRERIVGSLNAFFDDEMLDRASFATIIRQDWARHPADLDDVDIAAFKSVLRKNIADAGIEIGEGFIIGCFEASYNISQQCYQFHAHLLAIGDYVDAINALKGRKPYQPWAGGLGVPDCQHPIENPQLPIDEAARAFAYSLKGYWELRNAGPAKRLQGDEHTRSLLFLDRHRPEDLFILMGVHVKGGVLAPTV